MFRSAVAKLGRMSGLFISRYLSWTASATVSGPMNRGTPAASSSRTTGSILPGSLRVSRATTDTLRPPTPPAWFAASTAISKPRSELMLLAAR